MEVLAAVDDHGLAGNEVRGGRAEEDDRAHDVVGAVIFLCTPAADFITGQTMVIDGGQYFH